MKVGSFVVGAAALAVVALTPAPAAAQANGQATGCATPSVTAVLGIGGSLSGCFAFTLAEIGENAGYVSQQYYWAGSFLGASGLAPSNAPNPSGTQFFNDDCGSNGADHTTFKFCTGGGIGPIANTSGELVLGLLVPDTYYNAGNSYWVFSGGFPTMGRNVYPAPDGYQAVLYQVSSGGATAAALQANAIAGDYVLAWEDLNTGCTAITTDPTSTPVAALSTSYMDIQYLSNSTANGMFLDNPNKCVTPGNGGGWSDADFNDSYIRIQITGGSQSITPEPMTMTLMATGLVGLAGAQLRRRRKNTKQG